MSIKFKLEKNYIIQFFSNNIVKTKSFAKVKIIIYLYILLFIVFAWLLTNDKDMKIAIPIAWLIISLCYNKFSNWIGEISYKRFFTKNFNKNESLYMFKEMEIDIKDDNLYINNSIEERNIKFDSITSINIVDEYLLIVLSNVKYFTIPLSVFSSIDKRNEFISLLEYKTNKNVVYSFPDRLLNK